MRKIQDKGVGGFLLDWSAVIAVILSILFFTFYTGASFLSPANLTNILRSMSITTILAVAMTVTLGLPAEVRSLRECGFREVQCQKECPLKQILWRSARRRGSF